MAIDSFIQNDGVLPDLYQPFPVPVFTFANLRDD